MAGIDKRVVSMSFDNAKFEANAAKTMATLSKLNASLKSVGATGLSDIDKAANKVTFGGLSSAIDKIKGKLDFSGAAAGLGAIENAASKVNLSAIGSAADSAKTKLSTAFGFIGSAIDKVKENIKFTGADKGFDEIEKASSRVKLTGANQAVTDLNKNIKFPGADAAFSEIERSAGRVKLSGITNAIQQVAGDFTILEGAAAFAFGNIATQAIQKGAVLAKSFSIAPIVGGLQEYSTNLNSIQTILANTKASGAGLKDVNAALQQLNKYSDQTIYNFSQMAKNIGTFTAAGVDLDTAVGSIKGIANLAALSGSNSEQASTAMYQLSQAISAGRVSLQDWNSVVNAGMGGTVFQRALATTAENMGTLSKGAVELKGKMKNVTIEGQSFRESITAKPGEESWLTSDVLTNTLQQFTGDLSAAELKAQGFNDAQIKAIQDTAKTAKLAATEVKTLGQVFDVAKETIGSGWANTFQLIFGDFEEAKGTFTGLSNTINGFINTNANARNAVLKDWKELGGRAELIRGIENVFKALSSVIKPIKEAFREIFPAKTGKDLFELTKNFADFAESLKIGAGTADGLKRTFAGFFAVLDIGKQIISGVFTVIGDLFKSASGGSGSFLDVTGSIGDFLVSLDEAIKKGDGLKNFFHGLASVLSAPIKLFGDLAGAISGLFGSGNSSEGLSTSLDGMNASLTPLSGTLKVVKAAWEGFLGVLGNVGAALGPVVDQIGDVFNDFGSAVEGALQNQDFSGVFQIIQTTLIGGIFLTIRKALKGGIGVDLGGGVLDKVKGTFDVLTKSVTAMQNNIKAGTLVKIASALALLSAAVLGLSFVDGEDLAKSLTAISVGFAQLLASMALLTKIGGAAGFIQAPFIAATMITLAVAMDILSIAIIALGKLSWSEIAKGLTGVAGAMLAIGVAAKTFPPSIILIGPALLPIAVAMNILAVAMKIFATMKWEEIAKGLVAVAGGLTAIGIGTKLMGPSILLIGPGLVGVAFSLTLLAGAVLAFGKMNLETIGKGIGGIAGSLVAIGLAIQLIPPTVALQAAGLILVAAALNGIALAVKLMGGMDMITLAKGIGAIAASLVVLAGGLTLMSGTLPGSAALLVAATALDLLAPAMGILGTLKWETIAKGLAAIGGAMVVIAGAGTVAGPGLVIAGAALAILGVGIAGAGAGVYLLAKGLVLLGSEGTKGIAIMIASLTALVAVVPKVVIDFAKGIVQILATLAALAPQIVLSMTKIMASLLQVIINSAPQVALAVTALITAFIAILDNNAGPLIAAGARLLISLLSGIASNVGPIIKSAADIMVNFLAAIANAAPRILAAGGNAVIKFATGLIKELPGVIKSGAEVLAAFLKGIANNIGKVLPQGAKVLTEFLKGIANQIPGIVSKAADVIASFIRGIASNIGKIVSAGVDLITKFIDAVAKNAPKMADSAAKAIVAFVHGTADAIRANSGALGAAGADLGAAIIEGMIRGLAGAVGGLLAKARDIAGSVLSVIKAPFHINSPSKATMAIGNSIMEGLALGMDNEQGRAIRSAETSGLGVIDAFTNVFDIHSPSRVMNKIGKQVGKGFAEGLLGSREDVKNSMTKLQEMLSSELAKAREIVTSERAKLKKLNEADKKDSEAIAAAQTTIDQNQALVKKLKAGHAELTSGLKKERTELLGLAKDFEEVSKKLEDANKVLDDAIKTRDDAAKSFKDQFSAAPSIDNESTNKLGDYMTAIANQAAAVAKFQNTLEQLRKLGLDDKTYQKLLADGTADQEFADQLLGGGKSAVDALNILDGQLDSASKILGDQAANNLYQAGVDAAKGLVAGLESEQGAIREAMEKIATAMIKAIKKKLHIKSPSREFAEVGKFSTLGLVEGLRGSSKLVTEAATQLGEDAMASLRESMKKAGDLINLKITKDPTITPVIDLTQAKKSAEELNSMLNVVPITAAASFGQASAISTSQQQIAQEEATTTSEKSAGVIFEQNNYSPKALTAAEIYRQTQNQLAQAKKALGLTA